MRLGRESCCWLLLGGMCLGPGVTWGGFSRLSNSDFENGLVDWQAEGSVLATGGVAELSDSQPPNTVLWQGVAFPVGTLMVEFDFLAALAGDVPPGAFPDTFFASTYFVDDLGSFDLAGQVFDDVVYLMDMDVNGVFNVSGTVGASDKGGEWLHYAGEFQNGHANTVMVFELYDLDGSAGNSSVRIDNVVVVVPEPGTLLLMVIGGMLLLGRQSRVAA